MSIVKVQQVQVVFQACLPVKGSTMIKTNVERNGAPFGQIWTFKNTATETYHYHARTLSGAYKLFPCSRDAKSRKAALEAAKEWMILQARGE